MEKTSILVVICRIPPGFGGYAAIAAKQLRAAKLLEVTGYPWAVTPTCLLNRGFRVRLVGRKLTVAKRD